MTRAALAALLLLAACKKEEASAPVVIVQQQRTAVPKVAPRVRADAITFAPADGGPQKGPE